MDYTNLSFFSDKSNSTRLPFYDEWRKEQSFKETKYYVVTEITQVKSGKGYMLYTTNFSIFLWGNASFTKSLLEALQAYLTRPEEGYELIVVVDKDKKKPYQIAANKDKTITWFYSKKLEQYSITELKPDLEESLLNPLL